MDVEKAKSHAKNLRKGRYSESNQIYLITSVMHLRQAVFSDFNLGRIVVQAMRLQHQQQNVNSLAFVIMPDHLHWLFALQNNHTLSQVMQNVKGSSSFQVQKIRRDRGEIESKEALWQTGFHDHALRKEEGCKVYCCQPIESTNSQQNCRLSLVGCCVVVIQL